MSHHPGRPLCRNLGFILVLLDLSLAACARAQWTEPDLDVNRAYIDGNGQLNVEIENVGWSEISGDPGFIYVFVDGRRQTRIALASLPDQSYRHPRIRYRVRTGVYLRGAARRIGVLIDPTNRIEERHEHQNTFSIRLDAPVRSSPDLEAWRISRDRSRGFVRIWLQNVGDVATRAGLRVAIRLYVDGRLEHEGEHVLALPIGPNGRGIYRTPDPIRVERDSRVRAEIEIIDDGRTPLSHLDGDNTNNVLERSLESRRDMMAVYLPYLYSRVWGDKIVWEGRDGTKRYPDWTDSQKEEMVKALVRAENGVIRTRTPPGIGADGRIGAGDAFLIYVDHVAHTLWVARHRQVPWRLTDFSDRDLALLFDSRELMRYDSGSDRYAFDWREFGSVTAWNPRIAYEFMSNFRMIREDPYRTVVRLTGWIRDWLVHASGGDTGGSVAEYGYRGPPPVDMMLYPPFGVSHVTKGCWGTTGFYRAVLRAVNIPVEQGYTEFQPPAGAGTDRVGRHSRPEFTSIGYSMPHGDDPYNRVTLPIAGRYDAFLVLKTTGEMQRYLNPSRIDCDDAGTCNTRQQQASYNAQRDLRASAVSTRSGWLLVTFLREGRDGLDEALRGPSIGGEVTEHVLPYFDAARRSSILADVEDELVEIGQVLGPTDRDTALLRAQNRVGAAASRFEANRAKER